MLDHSGREWRRLALLKCRITDLCTDEAGEWIGASGEDGSVAIAAVHTDEVHTHAAARAVRAMRISPDYGRNRDRPVIVGGAAAKLRLLKRAWLLGNTVERVLHEGEGPIRACAWRGSLVAWANDVGVKVFDVASDARVCYVEAPTGGGGCVGAAALDACPPRLVWAGDTRLLVCWGESVRVVAVRERRVGMSRESAEAAGLVHVPAPEPEEGAEAVVEDPVLVYVNRRYGEVASRANLKDSYAAGAAPYGEHIAVLTCEPAGQGGGSPLIELRILSLEGEECELSRDALALRGTGPATLPCDLHLACDPEGVLGPDGLPMLFIISPTDAIVASPRSVTDHIEWAWKRGDIARAVEVAFASPGALSDARLALLRDAHIGGLVDQGKRGEAARAAGKLLGSDVAAWGRWAAVFFGCGGEDVSPRDEGADALLECLPLPEGVTWGRHWGGSRPVLRLHASAYDLAMSYLIRADPVEALGAVRGWRARAWRGGITSEGEGGGTVPHPLNPAALLDKAAKLLVAGVEPARERSEAKEGKAEGREAEGAANPAFRAGAVAPLFSLVKATAEVNALLTGPFRSTFSTGTTQALRDLQAELLVSAGRPDAALTAALSYLPSLSGEAARVAGAHVLSLIRGHSLVSLAVERVVTLLEADGPATLGLLVERVDAGEGEGGEYFPIPVVLAQLRGRPRDQHAYLAALCKGKWEVFNGPSGAPFHALYARLAASFARPTLLPFLQATGHVSLEDMRALCEEGVEEENGASAPLQKELAWVLGRLGAAREALALLLDGLGDVRGAVEFVAGVGDDALWAELVARVVASGSGGAAGELIDALPGTGLDAVKVLAAVPADVPIPSLQTRLLKLLADSALSAELTVTCAGLVRGDTFGLHSRLVGRAGAARLLAGLAPCGLCLGPAAKARAGAEGGGWGDEGEGGVESTVVVYWCAHAFHASCLPTQQKGAGTVQQGVSVPERRTSSAREGKDAAGTRARAGSKSRGRSASGSRVAAVVRSELGRRSSSFGSVVEEPGRELSGEYGRCPLCFQAAGYKK